MRDYVNSSERELVLWAQGSDRLAYGRLVRLHKEKVFGAAYHMMGNYADADEMSQLAFVRAFQALNKFRIDSSFHTWIHRITVNLCLTHLKNRARILGLTEESADDVSLIDRQSVVSKVDWKMEKDEAKKRVWNALDKLKPEVRTTVVLVYLEEQTPREAAPLLGCAEATVHWRLFRARRFLKNLLKEGGE